MSVPHYEPKFSRFHVVFQEKLAKDNWLNNSLPNTPLLILWNSKLIHVVVVSYYSVSHLLQTTGYKRFTVDSFLFCFFLVGDLNKLPSLVDLQRCHGRPLVPFLLFQCSFNFFLERNPNQGPIQDYRGRQHTNLPDFPKNCMKLRQF